MLKILIIDDSLTIRKMLEKLFHELGCNVIAMAKDAKEGIELYEKYKPDFVTMDINMPEMSGMEALKIIRDKDKDANIVMLTSKGDRGLVAQAIKYGAKGYVLKPPSVKKLQYAIETVFPNAFAPEIIENKELDVQNYESTIKDTLTDLYTVQYMHYTIEHLVAIHNKNKDINLSISLINVDNSDAIALEFGSIQRDVMLTQIADEITNTLSEADIPVKLSNKEFAVFFQGATSEEIDSTVRKIRFKLESIKNVTAIGNTKLVVSTVIAHHKQGEKMIHFMERADKGLQ